MIKYNMNKIQGVDASIEVSLFEYGFAWILSDNKAEIKFYYGTQTDNSGNYCLFDFNCIDTNINLYDEYNWIDTESWEGVYSFFGMSKQEFDNQELPQKIFDLNQYYGYQNIFGETYSNMFTYNVNINRFCYK